MCKKLQVSEYILDWGVLGRPVEVVISKHAFWNTAGSHIFGKGDQLWIGLFNTARFPGRPRKGYVSSVSLMPKMF